MSLRLFSLLAVFVYLFLLLGCQSSTTEPVTAGYDYFPLETGRYIIYDVLEQQYMVNAVPVQRVYQLKEVVGTTYSDVTGQMAYRLMRYKRATESQPWQADSVWSARIVTNEAIRSENGQDFVKLLLPVKAPLTWNGNRRNAFGPDTYVTRNIGQSYYVQGKQFDETVMVVAQDDSTLISRDKRIDVYARQIGLVYKERTQFQFCIATPACIGHSQIEYGLQQIYRIRTYGKE